jgi:NAD(P)-dependent dehydrogenase (short-subunit alcohol dehydrogenase family)
VGTANTGGAITIAAAAGTATTSGAITVSTANAGVKGVSGALSFSSGTTSKGGSGDIALTTGASTGGKGGRIVNVASNSGIFGGRGRAAYGASKAGIINLTQTMAIELAEYDILVNAVAPGPTKTKADQPDEPWPSVAMRMPLKRYGRPEEIAEVAAFLASPACSFTTGHVISADGGFTISGIMEG